MMRKALSVIAVLAAMACHGQELIPSNTYVRTCLSDIECSSINSSSLLFYDEGKSKFYIMIDFNTLKTGVDSVDFWLEDLNDTYYYFKAPLMKEQLPMLSNYNRKTIRLNGESFLNGIWHTQTIDVTVFRAEKDMMDNSINATRYEAYRVNLNFTIVPTDFNIHKKPQHLTSSVFVGIGSGQINLLQPSMAGMLGEAYDHE